jgi:hypothetical protein
MSAFSDYLENGLVDWIFRAQPPPTFGANLYVGLLTSAPNDANAGTEVSAAGTGYARVAVARSLNNFSGTQGPGTITVSTGTSGQTDNNVNVTFPTPTGSWGAVTHMGIYDAVSGGNLLFHGALTASISPNTGQLGPTFTPSDLRVTLA